MQAESKERVDGPVASGPAPETSRQGEPPSGACPACAQVVILAPAVAMAFSRDVLLAQDFVEEADGSWTWTSALPRFMASFEGR